MPGLERLNLQSKCRNCCVVVIPDKLPSYSTARKETDRSFWELIIEPAIWFTDSFACLWEETYWCIAFSITTYSIIINKNQ